MACPAPVGIANGVILSSTNISDGGRVYYSCNAGFSMTGAASQLCQAGAWIGAAPSCSSTAIDTNVTISGLEVPIWVLVLFIVLLVAIFLALFILLSWYCCCRDCSCCRRTASRQTWHSDVEDRHYYAQRPIEQYHHHRVPDDDAIFMTNIREDRPGRFVSHTETRPGAARIIRVQPGQRLVVLQDDNGQNNETVETIRTRKIQKEVSNAKKNNNNINTIHDGVFVDETAYVVLDPHTPSSTPSKDNASRLQNKPAENKQPKWMPHSHSIRTDASHANTTTR